MIRCTACGESSKRLQRHHYGPEVVFGGYSSTFPVRLLCPECHAEFHDEEKKYAREGLLRLEWSDLPETAADCERCTQAGRQWSGAPRMVAYAFWSAGTKWHQGGLCFACFWYFAGEMRRYHKGQK